MRGRHTTSSIGLVLANSLIYWNAFLLEYEHTLPGSYIHILRKVCRMYLPFRVAWHYLCGRLEMEVPRGAWSIVMSAAYATFGYLEYPINL